MSWDPDRVISLMLEAGEIARHARRNLRREFKADASVVTQADREIEQLITGAFEDVDAGVRIIGEETIDQKGEAYVQDALRGETYVVDPIDGTAPFAYGLPNWGVSIGYMRDGKLEEGAVFLADYGELVISAGGPEGAVRQGVLEDGSFDWRDLPPSPVSEEGLIAITQAVAKHGRCSLPNPVMALGAAVVPLVGLLQGRFRSYLGTVKLWDVAGALPLVLRHGWSASLAIGDERTVTPVTCDVNDATYRLDDPEDPTRWFFRSSLLICRQGEEAHLRNSLIENAE